jgi:Flp pilus assembly protein TadD
VTAKTRKQRLEELLAADPNDSFVRYGLAMEHVSAGQDEEAVLCLRELMQRDPDYVAAYQQAGQALARLGREDEARAAFRQGIAAAQRKGDAHAASEMTGFLEGMD